MKFDKRRFVKKKNHGKFFPTANAIYFDKKTIFEVEVRPRSKYSCTLMRLSVDGRSDEEVKFKAIRECCAIFQGQILDNPNEWVVSSMTEKESREETSCSVA